MKMRITFLAFFSLLWFLPIFSQSNLIPNPDFEEYFTCDYNEIDGTPLQDIIPAWLMVGTRTGEYYNDECVDDPLSEYYMVDLPFSPQSGKGYIRLTHSYDDEYDPFFGIRRDYTQVELLENLEVGKQYFLSYYLTDDENAYISHYGVHFSDTLFSYSDLDISTPWEPIILNPTVEVDTLVQGIGREWTKITHCFEAVSPAKFMVLGIFAEPNEIMVNPNHPGDYADLFYDNFYLTEIEPNLTVNNIEGIDTICAGDCITLSTNHSLIDGEWQWVLPGSDLGSSTDSVVTVCYDTPGVYDVHILVDHCVGSFENDFLEAITVLEGIEHTSPWLDTLICPGEMVSIDLSDVPYALTWLDGSIENIRTFTAAGSYTYLLSNGYCEKEYTITVGFTNVVEAQNIETSICPEGSYEVNNEIYGLEGTFFDTLRNTQGCDSLIFRIEIEYFPAIPIDLAADDGFCEDEMATLEIVSNHQSPQWSNGEITPFIEVNEAGDYEVLALDVNGCEQNATWSVSAFPSPQVTTGNLLDTFFEIGMALPVTYFGSITEYSWTHENGDEMSLDCYNCPFPNLVQPVAGIYEIVVSNEFGCTDEADLLVSFKEADVYVPNVIRNDPTAFINGSLFPQSENDFFYDLKIFDRWGGLLFEIDNQSANNATQGWRPDGSVMVGVYVWMITFEENGKTRVLSGDVTVL